MPLTAIRPPYWVTQWKGGSPTPPHELQISLGGRYTISGLRYLPRQDGSDNGRIRQYEIYVSTDGANWGTAVASGTFADTAAEQEVLFAPVPATHVRLVALNSYDGDPWTAVAEINVLGDVAGGNLSPNGVIDTPLSDITIAAGDSVDFSGTGTDPENDLPLSYLWSFGAGSGLSDATSEDPGPRQFSNPGSFTVTFTVTDATGLSDPTPAVRLVTVQSGTPVEPLPQTNWSVWSDSEELTGEDGAASNAFDGDPATYWVTQWKGGSPTPPHELQISLGGRYTISGLRYLPRQDGSDNGRIRQYEIYVSTDGANWGTAVASGTFADTAAEQEVLFAPVPATHVRLVALNSYDGDPWTAVAEINVLGDVAGGNLSPNGVIDTPLSDITIAAGDSVDFSGTGTDPENDLPLSYLWSFGAGSGLSDATSEDPGPRQFSNPGSFTVTFTVTDATGLSDPTPAVRLVTVQSGTPVEPLPQTNWSVWSDSEELTGEDGAASNAFDGDPATYWVTQWKGGSPTPPHELQISLGGRYTISGLRYLPRQDGSDNGRIRQYEIYVSTDGANWGTAVASGTFADTAAEQEVLFAPVPATHVRLVALNSYDGDPWTAVAEINVLGDVAGGNLSPNGVIDTPLSDITIAVGDSVDFSGTGTDPENDLPLSYLWSFGAGSGLSDATSEDPGPRQFSNPGSFTVTFTVTDATGLSDPTPAVRLVTVQSGTPVEPLPQTNWSVWSVDSEELAGEDGAASNAFDGDPATKWVTQWNGGSPTPPHELQISLGGRYTISGLRYLPRQDGSDNGRIRQYEIYVSTDGASWGTAVASGTFADTAAEQEVLFAPVPATHVRLVALNSYDGDPWTAVAEINMLGDVAGGNLSPNGVIDTPLSDITIEVGDSVDFSGTGTDPENDLPLSYLWSFGAGSGLSDATSEDPGPRQFSNPGSFTVTFTVTDATGLSDPIPDSRKIYVCTPPSVSIDQPAPLYLQSASNLFVSATPCLDPLIHSGWGVQFAISQDGGAVISYVNDNSAPFETTFPGLGKAEYTIDATIIDDLSNPVSGSGSDQASPVGIGDYYVSVGDSITFGLGDDIVSDNTSLDGRNTMGGYEPVLNNLLTSASTQQYPHTVVNEGVAGDTSIEGLNLIPTILTANPEAGFFLIQYGTNDAGIPLPSGLGKQPGQSGYNGTFKDNIQQIITQINNAGKKAYLAKAPYAKGAYLSRNSLIQTYNQVIDELITENNIAINGIPFNAPDFYTFFFNNQTQYSDDLHPNGTGYQSMGNLWANQLLP